MHDFINALQQSWGAGIIYYSKFSDAENLD